MSKINTIEKLIETSNITIISSVDEDGFPCTKAMLPARKREGLKVFYFSTNTSSIRVSHFRNNPKACLYFFNKRFFQGVLIKGTVEVLEDYETKKMIWNEGDEMYYSKGIEDSDYCVLKFTSSSFRFYQNFNSKNYTIEDL